MLAGVYPQAKITTVKTVPSRKKLNFFMHSIPGDLTGLERGATIRLPASIVSDHSATSGDARCRRSTACTGIFLLVSQEQSAAGPDKVTLSSRVDPELHRGACNSPSSHH